MIRTIGGKANPAGAIQGNKESKERLIPFSQIQGYASTLVARAELGNRMGISYDGDRNLYQALGYKETLAYKDFVTQFIRQDIARAVIERPVKVTWSGPLSVIESKDAETTNLEKDWVALERYLKLKSMFVRLDKLTGLGRYGVLLLGFDDVTNVQNWATPVKKGKRKLLYVRPLGESSAIIDTWVTDTTNERYGLPELYNVILTQPQNGASTFNIASGVGTTIKVHYSRVIHVVENAMESETEGTPRLEVVFNRLQDLEKLVGGSAEMFWRGARPGYAGEVDKEYSMGTPEKEALKDQIDEYEHNLRRLFINQGVKLQALATQISDPKSHVDVQLMMISAVTGIPKRILSGSERGELASSQDAAEWIAFVQGRREEFAEPHIIRPFIDRMIEYGVLPKPNVDYSIEWADLFSVSEKDKVEIGRIRATALREYFVNPLAPEVIPPDAFMEFFLGLTQSQIDLITEMVGGATIRSIKEEDAAFQAELEAKNAPPIVVPKVDPSAKPTADKKVITE